LPAADESIIFGYAYPKKTRVLHRKALSCSLGKKEPFSGTMADEKASYRGIESTHRKPEHDLWVRVPKEDQSARSASVDETAQSR
jgi:hypothetical protein